MTLSFVSVSAPQFVVGLLLLYRLRRICWAGSRSAATARFAHLVLPALTLGILRAAAGIRA